MPSEIRFEEFRRLFERQGVEFLPGGKHWKMRKCNANGITAFPLATVGARYVKFAYIPKGAHGVFADAGRWH